MNYAKLQADVVSLCVKAEVNKKCKPRLVYARYDNLGKKYIAFGTAYTVHLVPEEYCYVDIDKCLDSEFKGIIGLIEASENAIDTFTEGVIKPLDNYKVQIFKNKIDEIWVDTNFLKLFDMKKATFKGTDQKSVLYVYENEELVGFVFPVRHHYD